MVMNWKQEFCLASKIGGMLGFKKIVLNWYSSRGGCVGGGRRSQSLLDGKSCCGEEPMECKAMV
jgi:hypothetical protein